MRPLPETAPDRFGVFTAAEARAGGWTGSALRHAVRRERLIRLQSGLYVAAAAVAGEEPEQRRSMLAASAVAAVLAVGRAAASHASAAVLARLPVWEIPHRPCVTVPPRYTGDAERAHLHRARLDAEQIVTTTSVPRTRSARTILDVGREHGVEAAVVVGDAALRRQLTTLKQLHRAAAACAGWPGSRRALRAIEQLDPRSDSPLESVSRVRLAATRIPAPELQTEITTLDGVSLGWLDFYWDEFGVAGEVDGRLKYLKEPGATFWKEKQRQEAMEDTELIFVRWGRIDLETMSRLTARIEAAFARGSRLPRADRRWIAWPSSRLAPPTHVRWSA